MANFTQKNDKNSHNMQAETIIIDNGSKSNEENSKEKTMTLRERFENHIVIFGISLFATGFAICFGIITGYIEFSKKELVYKDSYILKTDLSKELSENYITKKDFEKLKLQYSDTLSKNEELQKEINSLQEAKRNGWYAIYNQLKKERDGLEKKYNNLLNLANGIAGYDATKDIERKMELQSEIKSRQQSMDILLEKLEL